MSNQSKDRLNQLNSSLRAFGDQQERQPLLNEQREQSHGETNGNANGNANNAGKSNIVSWEDGDEGMNPREWSKKKRWGFVILLCGFAAVVTYTCIGIVPVAGDVVKELEGHKDREAAVLFVTIWEVGEACGPLFLAPLSEIFGRWIVYNVANCFFIGGVVISALSGRLAPLIFSRFLTGCAVASNVLGPAIVGDIFPSESRGAAMSAVMLAPLIGGALGPTISGTLAEATGWRQIMWMCCGIAVVIEICFLFLFKETYAPVILNKIAKKKREQTGDDSWTTEYEQKSDVSSTRYFLQSMFRPFQIIWSSSMLQFLSIWGGLTFSFFYVNSTSLPEILEVIYDFSASKRGVSYLAWSAGSATGIIVVNRGSDWIYNKLTKRRGGFYPEARLPLSIFGAFFFPISVSLYGWSAQLRAPVGLFLFCVATLSFSVVLSIVPLMTYITDAFGNYSASALTAILVLRCLMGAFLPLTVPPMADKMGYGFAFLILASSLLVTAPIPVCVMRYGPSWRQKSVYSRDQ